MKVKAGLVVQIDVELKVKGGDVIESSKKSGLVAYTHGSGQMLAGLEHELEGLEAGAEKSGVIPAKDAFGTAESQPIMKVPRASFPKDAKLEVGERFEAKGPTGTPVTLRVTAVDGETVTAQVVHPLAGKDVEFKVKVVSVKPPIPTKPAPPISLEEIEPEPSSRDTTK
jgi:FKBP-type peptidyl-prolyl cis-trans isomerase SlyD